MKKLSLGIATICLFAGMNVAVASDWQTDLQNAVKDGKFSEIDVIAANNPTAQGQIALYLLNQAQADISSQPDTAIKLLAASTTFADQIPVADAGAVSSDLKTLLSFANNADFQKKNPKGASTIFAATLAISSDPNIIVGDPNLHNLALADASDFLDKNPSDGDQQLSDEVSLALQVGSPPPLGPHGVRNPSHE